MPALRSTGTTRRPPLRNDRGVKLYAPTATKPVFRVVAQGQVERTSAAVSLEHLAASQKVKFDPARLDLVTARARREADELFDQMVRWAKHQPALPQRGDRTINALCDRRLQALLDGNKARTTYDDKQTDSTALSSVFATILVRVAARPGAGNGKRRFGGSQIKGRGKCPKGELGEGRSAPQAI